MKMTMVRLYQFLDQNLDIEKLANLGAWILSLLLAIYSLILLSLPLYETSVHKGLLYAKDTDGGRAIEVSMATRWYNSNHFAAYGNLYYRFSHTIADLIPLQEESLRPEESKEKTHNFAMKVVSLLSVFSIGLFFGYLLLGMTPEAVLFSSIFTLAALKIPLWTEWVYRPHPEHLLMLMLAMALYAFSRFLTKPDDRRMFVISALLWGLSMAVKRSTAAFVPAILVFLIFPINKDSWKRTLNYVGLMLLAYFLIGFPQNFGLYKHIKFMMYESAQHSLADINTVLNGLTLSVKQLWPLLPSLVVFSFFSERREKNHLPKFALFVILSALPVLLRKLSFTGDHHTMPIAISFFVLIFIALMYNPFRWKWPKWKRLVLFILGLLTLKILGVPPTYSKAKDTHLTCQVELTHIIQLVSDKISPDFKLIKEAYYPFNHLISQNMTTEWGIRWEDIRHNIGFLGIQESSYRQYFDVPPSHFNGPPLFDWDKKRDFYTAFRGQNSVTSPEGSVFKKIYSACGYELWARE